MRGKLKITLKHDQWVILKNKLEYAIIQIDNKKHSNVFEMMHSRLVGCELFDLLVKVESVISKRCAKNTMGITRNFALALWIAMMKDGIGSSSDYEKIMFETYLMPLVDKYIR